MLVNLCISDLAVVKNLNLDLDKGMTVLTGETGAGKSILLTALGLALGDRADSGYIRPSCKRAEINLEFDISDALSAQTWLQENQLDDQDQCLIRRVINQDGRSKAYINDRPVTLQTLQTLSEKLVEIHGQHEHLTLLHADEQRRLLDNFGKNHDLLVQIESVFRLWQETDNELSSLIKSSTDQTAREELLNFQLEELKQLDLANFNYSELNEEHNKLAHLGELLTKGHQQLEILYEAEAQSVNQILGESIGVITDLENYASELTEINQLLNESQIQIQEACQQLRRYLESLEADPKRLDWLENQIGVIQNLSRKHHVNPEQLPELAVQLAQELEGLTHSTERIDALKKKAVELEASYQSLALELSRSRQETGKQLQKEISDMIKELGMPQGDFLVNVTSQDSNKPRISGNDKVEFLVSANPGLPPKTLAKVASGGELSRISLAIQVIASNEATTPTMIFDEVDTGIGGGIAEIVGQKLSCLSHNRQVICITHLPQVACQGQHHLFVFKNNENDITSSNVKLLSYDERVQEIARMLGGVNITENTLAHAKEMLNLAETNFNSTITKG